MFLASVFAAGAILVRQAGIAMIPAAVAMWLLRRRRGANLPLLLSGIVLPLAAWCVPSFQTAGESAADAFNRVAQAEYFHRPLADCVRETVQRAGLAAIYLAAFAMPLALLAIPVLFRAFTRASGDRPVVRVPRWTVAMGAALVAAAIGITFQRTENWRFPYIVNSCFQLAWIKTAPCTQELFTLLAVAAAVAIVALYWREMVGAVRSVEQSPLLLLHAYSLFMLALTLLFFQFVDRYMLPMLPGLIIVLFRQCRRSIRHFWPAIALGCFLWSIYQAEILGRELRSRTAAWTAAERLLASGVPAQNISAPGWEWIGYHRFEDWVAESHRQDAPQQYYSGYYDWVQHQRQASEYEVVVRIDGDRALNMANVEVLDRIPVRTYLWKHGYVYVVRHVKPQ
jgi:hypothetical protein